jgi:hypothetical protein
VVVNVEVELISLASNYLALGDWWGVSKVYTPDL